jgi:hypothetical protein
MPTNGERERETKLIVTFRSFANAAAPPPPPPTNGGQKCFIFSGG